MASAAEGGEAANGSRSGGNGVDELPSASAESVASIEPVPAVLLPNAGRNAAAERCKLSLMLMLSPSLFLNMFVNIFLSLTDDVGKRNLSPLSNVIDWRGEERGEEEVVNDERGRLENRDDTELEVE